MISALEKFKGKKVLITGVGRYKLGSNNSAARFFASAGAKIMITDPKPAVDLVEGLKHLVGLKAIYHLGGYSQQDFTWADFIVKNQGVRALDPFIKIAEKKGVHSTTDVGVFMHYAPDVPIVGVTGTRGKSTTTALIGEMISASGCEAYMGGNMKVSPLNFLDKLRRDHKSGRCAAVVLELSSWLLEGWKKEKISPKVAVITNVYPDHLNTYTSYAAYIAAKAEIFASQKKGDAVVLNRDNPLTRRLSAKAKGKVYWFSKKPFAGRGAFTRRGWIIWKDKGEEAIARASSSKHLAGEHNLENILAAVTAAKLLGIKKTAIAKALKSFKGLPDRQELVRNFRGADYVNDTTATSPDGTVAALHRFGGPGKKIVLIAGGRDKGLDYRGLAAEIKKHVDSLILFEGTATDKILAELKTLHYEKDIAPLVKDMRTAVRLAASEAEPGSVVLLSPGAASFGLFQNEFDRGERFVKEVKKL